MKSIISSLTSKVHAAPTPPSVTVPRNDVSNIFSSIPDLIQFAINVIFVIGLSISLIFVIVGGIKYVTSGGNQEKAEEARNTIINAIIGAVVIVAFRVIINIVLDLIGVDLGNVTQATP